MCALRVRKSTIVSHVRRGAVRVCFYNRNNELSGNSRTRHQQRVGYLRQQFWSPTTTVPGKRDFFVFDAKFAKLKSSWARAVLGGCRHTAYLAGDNRRREPLK